MSDKLAKEREATASTMVVQGYVIFFIFLIIVLVMQYKILPLISSFNVGSLGGGISGVLGGTTTAAAATVGNSALQTQQLGNAFLFLILTQGFFTGLTIGKLSEGNIKAGIKHSFAMMVFSFIISAGAGVIFG